MTDKLQQDLEERLATHKKSTTDLWELSQNTLLQMEAYVLKAYGIDGQFVVGEEELYTWKDGVLDNLIEDRVLVGKLNFINWEVQYLALIVRVPLEDGDYQKVKCLQVTQIVNGGTVPTIYRISHLANSLLKPAGTEG